MKVFNGDDRLLEEVAKERLQLEFLVRCLSIRGKGLNFQDLAPNGCSELLKMMNENAVDVSIREEHELLLRRGKYQLRITLQQPVLEKINSKSGLYWKKYLP